MLIGLKINRGLGQHIYLYVKGVRELNNEKEGSGSGERRKNAKNAIIPLPSRRRRRLTTTTTTATSAAAAASPPWAGSQAGS